MTHSRQHNQRGFTIVELMIALTIMSIILLLSSVVLLEVGKLYAKGKNSVTLQNASRAIILDVSSELQLNGATPFSCSPVPNGSNAAGCATNSAFGTSIATTPFSADIYAYCIGTTRYSFVLDMKEVSGTPNAVSMNRHVIWKDTMVADTTCKPLNITKQTPDPLPGALASVAGSGSELAPINTRLTRFYVQAQSAGIYALDVWMIYGDKSQSTVTTSTGPGGCVVGTGSSSCAGYSTCIGGAGQEYCALSPLSTVISRRLR
jgi:prepilin-type N-terminal cleavage/methylation domain-containing protein